MKKRRKKWSMIKTTSAWTSAAVALTIAEVGVRIEHAADDESTNVPASGLNRLPSL